VNQLVAEYALDHYSKPEAFQSIGWLSASPISRRVACRPLKSWKRNRARPPGRRLRQ